MMRLSLQVTGLGSRERLGHLPIGTHPTQAIVELVRIILRSMYWLLVMLLGGMMVLGSGSPCRLCWNGLLPLLMTVMETEYLTHVILIKMEMGFLMSAMRTSMGTEFPTRVMSMHSLNHLTRMRFTGTLLMPEMAAGIKFLKDHLEALKMRILLLTKKVGIWPRSHLRKKFFSCGKM